MPKRTRAIPKVRRASGAGADPSLVAPSRAGHVNITGYFPVGVRSALRLIQAQQPNATIQSLLGEALNLLFKKYGVPEAAPKPQDR